MTISVIYVYAIINAVHYREIFDDSDSEGYDLCKTLLSCLIYVVDMGLRNGGGVAESHSTLPFHDPTFGPKIIFNLTFFALINVIALNIVFGIILDSFAQLRDDEALRSILIFLKI